MSTPFQRIFKLYKPDETCAEAVEAIFVDAMSGDRRSRAITVRAVADRPVPTETLRRIEDAVREFYGLEQFSVELSAKKLELTPDCLPKLFLELKAAFPATNGFLNDAVGEIDRAQGALCRPPARRRRRVSDARGLQQEARGNASGALRRTPECDVCQRQHGRPPLLIKPPCSTRS